MHKSLAFALIGWTLTGCAAAVPVAPQSPLAAATGADGAAPIAVAGDPARPVDGPARTTAGPWIGAAGASDFVLAGTSETVMGVWVDVPAGNQKSHAPTSVALVIDTSGSMAGPKMENARAAARSLVDKLSDGDIVSIHTFSDEAHEVVAPTVLTPGSRSTFNRAIAEMQPLGGTNMFDGLRMGEGRALGAPASHPVRRIVVISDGLANIGPSSPQILGGLAGRGAEHGVQVTAMGVGLDYDETTLNALATRSSGRLYHLSDPNEMLSILDRELGLLQATAATEASLEVVPAPGVQILGADGVSTEWAGNGVLRLPLGTMFAGQHREMLVRVRVTAPNDGTHPLASVRFHFRDPAEGNLDRVQEVIARYQVTGDRLAIDAHVSAKTRTIVATQEAAQATASAAQKLNAGQFETADKDLAVAETKFQASAASASTMADRQRSLDSAARIAKVRVSAKKAMAEPFSASKPAPMRAPALDANEASMKASGF